MKTKISTSRKTFERIDDTVRKMRRTDPIQFDVLYNDWKRLRERNYSK